MMMDFQEMMTTVFPEMMAVGIEPQQNGGRETKRDRAAHGRAVDEVVRAGFLEATKAEDEARVRLPENLRNILDETGCSSPDEEEMPFP